MCKYCDLNNYNRKYENDFYDDWDDEERADPEYKFRLYSPEIPVENYINIFMVYNEFDDEYGLYISGEALSITLISYCPFCGRKLIAMK